MSNLFEIDFVIKINDRNERRFHLNFDFFLFSVSIFVVMPFKVFKEFLSLIFTYFITFIACNIAVILESYISYANLIFLLERSKRRSFLSLIFIAK